MTVKTLIFLSEVFYNKPNKTPIILYVNESTIEQLQLLLIKSGYIEDNRLEMPERPTPKRKTVSRYANYLRWREQDTGKIVQEYLQQFPQLKRKKDQAEYFGVDYVVLYNWLRNKYAPSYQIYLQFFAE